jgi:hypothetical protein
VPLDVASLKARLGIAPGDTTSDAAIEAVATQAQALCESYCDRKFDLAADEETFEAPTGALLLRRWPIVVDPALDPPALPVSIADEAARVVPAQNYRVDKAHGVIRGRSVSWAPGWAFGWCPLVVTYTGGLDPWPSDLIWSVTAAFDVLWSETPGGGLPAGGAAGASGDVKKYSVVGAFSVETVAGAAGEIGANAGEGWGPLPASITRGLDAYRRESAVGVG